MPVSGGAIAAGSPLATTVVLADGILLATALLAIALELYVGWQKRQEKRLWWALILLGLFLLLTGRIAVHFLSVLFGPAVLNSAAGIVRDLGFFAGRLLILLALPAYLTQAFGVLRPRFFPLAIVAFVGLSLSLLWWVIEQRVPPWREAVNYLTLAVFVLPVALAVGQLILRLPHATRRGRHEVLVYAGCGGAIVAMTVLHLVTQGVAGVWSYLPLNLAYAAFFLASSFFAVETLVRPTLEPPLREVSSPEAAGLSPREAEIVELVRQGLPNASVGEKLFISTKTVESHLYRIYQKLGVKNRVQLVRRLWP